ncbi:MAG: hypothetical protein JSV45_07545 [Chromatiales bacterium]|nr:MAG: hypothetical protein JSV45_07545 [Chromatiales bacterium]
MSYIDWEQLESISVEEFEAVKPYPFANRKGLLTDSGFERLLENMPDIATFDTRFGEERLAGQEPHDRYSLEYKPDTQVPVPWQEFIAELRSARYRENIARLLRAPKIEFRFHWHYTPSGCSVSPHTDSSREKGSHLFYFNSEDDWDPSWGGETLALDDGGKLDFKSAPELSEFKGEIAFQSIGNYSAIMKRTDHAWHAVRPINCPEDRLRRIFIVVCNPASLFWKARDRIIGKKKQAF